MNIASKSLPEDGLGSAIGSYAVAPLITTRYNLLILLARPRRFELLTFAFGGQRFIPSREARTMKS